MVFKLRVQWVGALAALAVAGCSASAGSSDATLVSFDAPAALIDGAVTDAMFFDGESQGNPVDAEFISNDGQLPPDAPVVTIDAPMQNDSQVATADAFVAPPDAFVAPPDAFVAPPDAFVAPPDAFVAPPDAFVAPPDAHITVPDAAPIPASCSAVVLETPLPTGASAAGTPVTLSASATCTENATPLFQWWLQLQGQTPAAHFFNLGNYAASSSVMWDTTGVTAGTYNIQVYLGLSDGSSITFQRGSTLKSKVLD